MVPVRIIRGCFEADLRRQRREVVANTAVLPDIVPAVRLQVLGQIRRDVGCHDLEKYEVKHWGWKESSIWQDGRVKFNGRMWV